MIKKIVFVIAAIYSTLLSAEELRYENQIALTEFLIKHVKEVTAYSKDNSKITVK